MHDLQIPLSTGQQARMEQLAVELGTDVPRLDEDDTRTRLSPPWRASFTLSGRFGTGRVRNASGAGVAIETKQVPTIGERVVLELQLPGHNTEYTFPGDVAWRDLEGTPSFGVRLQGVPSETGPTGRRASGVYPSELGPKDNGDHRKAG
jgi:Tfp pilus assembly protein PilZ